MARRTHRRPIGMSRPRETDRPLGALRRRVEPWIGEALRRSADLGFLGSMPVDEQIDHALGFVHAAEAALQSSPLSVVDLGSGGGVPGLVLRSCWPDCNLVLIDSNERRAEFLTAEAVGRPGTGKVEVMRCRAEEAGRMPSFREQCDLVTSRSFGAPAVAAECGAPFLVAGGVMVVSEPPESDGDIRWPSRDWICSAWNPRPRCGSRIVRLSGADQDPRHFPTVIRGGWEFRPNGRCFEQLAPSGCVSRETRQLSIRHAASTADDCPPW